MVVAQTSEAKRIFLEAVELGTPDAWSPFLDNACNGDATLRQRVETLLNAHAQSNALLDGNGLVATIAPPATEQPGTLMGPYKLLEQIGEGGMGLVYMAEQQRLMRRLVALKLIKPGMDSKQVIARFEAEIYRQATTDLKKKVLKGTRWLLLKNPENLDPVKGEPGRLHDEAQRQRDEIKASRLARHRLRAIL